MNMVNESLRLSSAAVFRPFFRLESADFEPWAWLGGRAKTKVGQVVVQSAAKQQQVWGLNTITR
jgi:hypothetical protein